MITKHSCDYTFHPSKTGEAVIKIYRKSGGKLSIAGQFTIIVDSFPDPLAFVGRIHGSFMAKRSFAVQQGVGAHVVGIPIELHYDVQSFMMTVTRNNEIVFSQFNSSAIFNDTIKEFFNTLQEKDVVVFSSIIVRRPDEIRKLIKPIEFIIKQ